MYYVDSSVYKPQIIEHKSQHSINVLHNYQGRTMQPFLLYTAFQHTHHPQFAGKIFTNSALEDHLEIH